MSVSRRILTAVPPAALATFAAAAAGGAAAWFAGLVGGWLIGALVAVPLLRATGRTVAVPDWIRAVALAFSGIMTGSTMSANGLGNLTGLVWSMTALALLTLIVVLLSFAVHRHFWKAASPTAFYSAWPGNTMLALVGAESSSADMDRVVLVQSTRVIMLVVLLPLVIGSTQPFAEPDPGAFNLDFAAASLIAAICCVIARKLSLVAGEMILTAIVVGGLTYAEILTLRPPQMLNSAFQVVVGAYIANHLVRCRLSALRAAAGPAIATAMIAAVLTVLFSWPMAMLLDMDPAALALAFAPGGAEPMILLSPVFGVDPGFVGAHHTVRLVGLTLVFPLLARFATAGSVP